jgi:hypothetical protein
MEREEKQWDVERYTKLVKHGWLDFSANNNLLMEPRRARKLGGFTQSGTKAEVHPDQAEDSQDSFTWGHRHAACMRQR